MELPKNITQIGESDKRCKIYVEDYVISYIRQLNLPAQDKDMAAALYGIRKEENEISYIFLYGACKLDFLQRESRHLSQAQQQEIERLRKKYFAEYQFMGYRLLNGEMVEGFHICENDVCRYVQGYAQFYEKNDSMLAYMLDTRQEEAKPEEVNQEKYNMVRQRQEERRAASRTDREHMAPVKEEETLHNVRGFSEKAEVFPQKTAAPARRTSSMAKMRFSAVAVFALLCVAGLAAMNGSARVDELQQAAREMVSELTRQQLPDAVEVANPGAQTDTLVAQDQLTDAIYQENTQQEKETAVPAETAAPSETAQEGSGQEGQTQTEMSADAAVNGGADAQAGNASSAENGASESGNQTEIADTPETVSLTETEVAENIPPASEKTEQQPSEPNDAAEASGPVGYVVQEGDTLIRISIRQYGTDAKVAEICALNQIENADDIQVGRKILLP